MTNSKPIIKKTDSNPWKVFKLFNSEIARKFLKDEMRNPRSTLKRSLNYINFTENRDGKKILLKSLEFASSRKVRKTRNLKLLTNKKNSFRNTWSSKTNFAQLFG